MSNFYNQQKTNAAYVVLLLFAFFAIAGTARAQLASTYVFATGTGATLQNMTGATQLIGAGVDDGQSAIFNIGFDFTFENVTYKQFSASSNGVIRLGGTAVGTGFTNSAASTTIQPKIMPM